MPAQLVSIAHGLGLVGLLGVPLAGSLLLALAVAPFADAPRSIIGLFLAIGAMVSTVLLTPLLLPLESLLVLVAALSMVVVAALAHRLSSWPVIGHIVAGALPMALLVTAIMGYVIGRFPLTYAAAFKPPLLLWALIHSATLCLATLLGPLGRGERQ
jgi:hypothetical protein